MKTYRLLPLVLAVTALQCANPNDGTGSSTESITAMLYNPDNSPAANAKICFYRHHDDPRTCRPVDSVWTDNNGRYKKDLDTGTYNILAELDTNATFQDSIVVTGGDTATPPPDTLRCRGNIRGKVELQGTDDPRTVFILFMGSNTFTRPTDVAGNFSAANMAKGRYAVTLITTLDDYDVMDTSILIKAGLDSTIPQPIVMRYTGIPVPQGLRIEYDTLKQIVTLFWNTPTTGRPLTGYNIYRKHQDSTQILLRGNWQDTVYHDSTGMQDITYEYRVAAIDTNTTEGTRSAGLNVTVLSAFHLLDSILIPSSGGVRLDVDTIGNAYVRESNNISRYDRNTKAVTGSWSVTDTFGVIRQIKWLNDTTLTIATTGRIGRFNLVDSTVHILCTDSGITNISLSNDTVFYIQGLWPDPNYKIKKLIPGADSGLTVISVNEDLPSLGVNGIENLTITPSAILFAVYRTIPITLEDREEVYQTNHAGENLLLISSLPWYTNQGPSLSVAVSSYYLGTSENVSGVIRTTFREYSLSTGEMFSQWKNLETQCELIRIIQSQIYVRSLGHIYIYERQ